MHILLRIYFVASIVFASTSSFKIHESKENLSHRGLHEEYMLLFEQALPLMVQSNGMFIYILHTMNESFDYFEHERQLMAIQVMANLLNELQQGNDEVTVVENAVNQMMSIIAMGAIGNNINMLFDYEYDDIFLTEYQILGR